MIVIDADINKVLSEFEKTKTLAAVRKAVGQGALLVERDAKKNCPIDTGTLRSSIISSVVETSDGDMIGTIGTPIEYAPYVEYGTGLFAANGNGRTDVPWHYQDGEGNWHTTSGQHPQPFLIPALTNNRERIVRAIARAVKEDIK